MTAALCGVVFMGGGLRWGLCWVAWLYVAGGELEGCGEEGGMADNDANRAYCLSFVELVYHRVVSGEVLAGTETPRVTTKTFNIARQLSHTARRQGRRVNALSNWLSG